MSGSANFAILRDIEKTTKTNKKQKKHLVTEECPRLLCCLGIGHIRRQTILVWNSQSGKEFFRASQYVWYLQY